MFCFFADYWIWQNSGQKIKKPRLHFFIKPANQISGRLARKNAYFSKLFKHQTTALLKKIAEIANQKLKIRLVKAFSHFSSQDFSLYILANPTHFVNNCCLTN